MHTFTGTSSEEEISNGDEQFERKLVVDTTPTVLHYQCVNHGYMGNSVQMNSNVSSGGSAYTSAFLSGIQTRTQIFTVPFDAPNTLVYQCTAHGGMVGNLIIVV